MHGGLATRKTDGDKLGTDWHKHIVKWTHYKLEDIEDSTCCGIETLCRLGTNSVLHLFWGWAEEKLLVTDSF
jgi:hypothetical protein